MASLEEIFGGQNSIIWCLSVDGFLKFQLKRKMLNQDGKTVFLRQATKMLKDIDLDQVKLDAIGTLSLSYAREEMQRNEVFTQFEEEARSVVYCDLVAAFQSLNEQLMGVGISTTEKGEVGG
tara:strand:- start:6 stop:371 length:366 start_codon:yes stop_codon:yes gene_type:complete